MNEERTKKGTAATQCRASSSVGVRKKTTVFYHRYLWIVRSFQDFREASGCGYRIVLYGFRNSVYRPVLKPQ